MRVIRLTPSAAALLARSAALTIAPAGALALDVTFSTTSLSGNAPQWPGVSSDPSVIAPMSGLRGSGLSVGGGLSSFSSVGVSTSPTLDLAANDFVSLGLTLLPGATSPYAPITFRATLAAGGVGSTGMKAQVWAQSTSMPLFAVSSEVSLLSQGAPTPITADLPASLILLPGEALTLRVYFWNAQATQNGIAFIDGDGPAGLPAAQISAIPIPAPGAACLVPCAALCAVRRRR